MRLGLLVTGDISVRAAHSLAAHPTVDEVVVIGPARSKNFAVVNGAERCDFLVGSGDAAIGKAKPFDVPLVWDGDSAKRGVLVWGANPRGLALALADREEDPRLVAMAHPEAAAADGPPVRFPDPIGRLNTHNGVYADRPLGVARSTSEFAACLVESAERRVTIVDDAGFLSGVALAAAIEVAIDGGGPVWDSSLSYLEAATEMGLVMAEGS